MHSMMDTKISKQTFDLVWSKFNKTFCDTGALGNYMSIVTLTIVLFNLNN